MRRRSSRRAFSLVEILIVVVILGILAAIVIPQFVSAAESATDRELRRAIEDGEPWAVRAVERAARRQRVEAKRQCTCYQSGI